MSIPRPEYLWLLVGLAPVALILLRGYVFGKRDLRILGGRWREEALRNVYLVKWFFAGLSYLVFLALSIVAVSGLSWGTHPVEEEREGVDVAMVIDVSRSMLAADVAPSRLQASVSLARHLVEELSGSRFSVVAFRGGALLGVPQTEDVASVMDFLDFVSPDVITTPGTDVEAGLQAALDSFAASDGRYRAIVLFSDGEFLNGAPGQAAQEARRREVPIFPVSVGTTQGAQIVLSDGTTVRDEQGNPVTTRLDRTVLLEVAAGSGGSVFAADDPNVRGKLANRLRQPLGPTIRGGFRLASVERYRVFVVAGLVFLLISVALRSVRWRETI
jgi:Ca-activated chloride channel family protein